VLFQTIAGTDVRVFGASEKAAQTLGISAPVALELQQVAWDSVTQRSTQLNAPTVDWCK